MELNCEQGGTAGLTVALDDLKGLVKLDKSIILFMSAVSFGLAQCSQLVMASTLTKAQNEGHMHMPKAYKLMWVVHLVTFLPFFYSGFDNNECLAMKSKFHYNISNRSIKMTEAPLNKGHQDGVGSSVAVHQNYPSSSPTLPLLVRQEVIKEAKVNMIW